MKKKLFSAVFVLILLFTSAFAIDLYVDGRKLEPDVAPVIVNGRTLVPLRSIFESLQASVTWDGTTKTAVATKGGNTVSITINRPTAYVNGAPVALDTPAAIINERTMVPVRFVSEALQANVWWEADTKTVYVATTTNYDGYRLAPDIIYTTTGEQNGLADVYMYADGTVSEMGVIEGFETCTLKTDKGSILIMRMPLMQGWERLKVGETVRICFQYLGYSNVAQLPTGAFFEVGNLSVAPVEPADNTAVAGTLKIDFLDVGQADSILLSCGGEAMLIDAGNNEDGDSIVAYLRSSGVSQLKYAVGTHPHTDHIGGMDDVFDAIPVETVLLPDAITTTKTFSDMLDAIERNNLRVAVPQRGDTYQLGGATITVVSAAQSDELNNTSLVLKATFGSTSFLFMGDAEAEVENAILRAGTDVKCDVLKLGHHGADTSTSDAFLAAASPKAAVISCGANNSYGHPSQSTLDKLVSVPVWRTDLNGTITAVSDGKQCTLTADKGTASVTQNKPQPTPPPTPTVPSTPTVDSGNQPGNVTPSTVYITPTGKRYHYSASCAGKNATPSTLSNAKSRGLTPCQKCAA